MAQAHAPQVDTEPAKKMKTAARSAACRANKKDCKHVIFRYEDDKRRHMFCCGCGRRRWIKIDKEGNAAVGRWVTPRKKKESRDDDTKASGT